LGTGLSIDPEDEAAAQDEFGKVRYYWNEFIEK
jgi:hypothetical protein